MILKLFGITSGSVLTIFCWKDKFSSLWTYILVIYIFQVINSSARNTSLDKASTCPEWFSLDRITEVELSVNHNILWFSANLQLHVFGLCQETPYHGQRKREPSTDETVTVMITVCQSKCWCFRWKVFRGWWVS